jgi:hypothetical protein
MLSFPCCCKPNGNMIWSQRTRTNIDSLTLVGTKLYVGEDIPTLYRGIPTYGVFPVDLSTGNPTETRAAVLVLGHGNRLPRPSDRWRSYSRPKAPAHRGAA